MRYMLSTATSWPIFRTYLEAEDHCGQLAGDTRGRYCVVEDFENATEYPFSVMEADTADAYVDDRDAEIQYTADYSTLGEG